MKLMQRAKTFRWVLGMLAAVSLSGCAIGFNKNGFYCTEGPVTEETPPCFRSAPPAKQPDSGAADRPAEAVKH
jgi:hypothetical protein